MLKSGKRLVSIFLGQPFLGTLSSFQLCYGQCSEQVHHTLQYDQYHVSKKCTYLWNFSKTKISLYTNPRNLARLELLDWLASVLRFQVPPLTVLISCGSNVKLSKMDQRHHRRSQKHVSAASRLSIYSLDYLVCLV